MYYQILGVKTVSVKTVEHAMSKMVQPDVLVLMVSLELFAAVSSQTNH